MFRVGLSVGIYFLHICFILEKKISKLRFIDLLWLLHCILQNLFTLQKDGFGGGDGCAEKGDTQKAEGNYEEAFSA